MTTSRRVLLAHRDATIQELAARTLGRIGVTLDVAADSADALAHIARERYDVIIIERDDSILAAIAAMYADKKPVVIVTTAGGAELNPHIVSLVVSEPYDPQMLVGVILACVTPAAPPSGASDSLLPAERGEG